jgi:predicted nucleic acid-binding protein
MSANKATYLDSSALVKLAVREPESAALRRYLRRRQPLIASALARTEAARPWRHAVGDAGRWTRPM